MASTAEDLTPPAAPSARFTLELEFVLSLANPYYLSHLAVTYPHLLNPPPPTKTTANINATSTDSDASRFAAYLSYLYAYWRTPEYSKYLTHPGAVLRSLELLQQERFRRDIIRPDVIVGLLEGGQPRQGDERPTDGQAQDPGDIAEQNVAAD